MSELIGAPARFKILQRRRSTNRTKEFIETFEGTIRDVRGNTVIIEGAGCGLGAGLHNRPISEIDILEVGK